MKSKFYDIPGSESWETIEFVEKGWSSDRKFHIITDTGDHLLLRLSDSSLYECKKQEFKIIQKLSQLGFEMSKAYAMGVCEEGVYMLLGWIPGTDLEEVMKDLNEFEQYKLGYEAGQILKKIHETDVDIETVSWEERFNQKIDRKILAYQKCLLKYKKGQLFIDCIQRSRELLMNRPTCLHHGDFHVGNMVFSKTGHVGIIDFNRCDYGDPWEEFNRIVWDVKSSHAFAAGRVDGYFNKKVPEVFFRLLASYISSNTLSSLPWAEPFGEEQVMIMKKQAEDVLYHFDDFHRVVPIWYTETKIRLGITEQ